MTRYAGTALYVKFGSTVLSGDHRTFEVNETAGEIDASAGNDRRSAYLPGRIDGEANMTLLQSEGGTALFQAVSPQSSGTLEWAPEGTASGKPKRQCLAVALDRSENMGYDEVAMLNIRFRLSGDLTESAY